MYLGITCVESNVFIIGITPFVFYFFLTSIGLWILTKWEYAPKEYLFMPFLKNHVVPCVILTMFIMLLSTIPFWIRCFRKDNNVGIIDEKK